MKRIEKIGRIVSKTNFGYLVVELKDKGRIPRIGWRVYVDNVEIGVVSDIIGNVARPHAVVKLRDKGLIDEIHEGAVVAVRVPPPRRARGKGRERRKRKKDKKMQRR